MRNNPSPKFALQAAWKGWHRWSLCKGAKSGSWWWQVRRSCLFNRTNVLLLLYTFSRKCQVLLARDKLEHRSRWWEGLAQIWGFEITILDLGACGWGMEGGCLHWDDNPGWIYQGFSQVGRYWESTFSYGIRWFLLVGENGFAPKT